MTQCPCGSKTEYLICCGLFIDTQATANTPEALMRSRYTAYSQVKFDYIKKTMRGKPLKSFNEIEVTRWAKQVTWTGLQIIKNYKDETDENIGYVEFIASYMEQGNLATLHELSQFQRHQGNWFYTDSLSPTADVTTKKLKISRNAPCPCGSQRKFKNCHGQTRSC